MDALVPVLLGYSLGSLPLGFLVAQQLRGVDLRRVGSGNVGAANAYRTSGVRLAILVVLIDIAKGAGSVMLAARLAAGAIEPVTAGLAAILGHMFPVWLKFRGGKGVATACGAFWVLSPLATALAAGVFAMTVALTRYVSVGSLAATAALPTLAWLTRAPAPVIAGGVVAALLILVRHRGNLVRLRDGTERRFGERARL